MASIAEEASKPNVRDLYGSPSGDHAAYVHPAMRHTRLFGRVVAEFHAAHCAEWHEPTEDTRAMEPDKDGIMMYVGPSPADMLVGTELLLNAMLEAFLLQLADVFKWPNAVMQPVTAYARGNNARCELISSVGVLRTLDECIADFGANFPRLSASDGDASAAAAASTRRLGQLFLLIVAGSLPDELDAAIDKYASAATRPATMAELDAFAGTAGRPKTPQELRAWNHAQKQLSK